MRRIVLAFAIVLLAPAASANPQGPSFDCSHVTSKVNKLICATPELSALDRELANDFQEMKGQPGIDQKVLVKDEARWLRDVRNPCNTVDCLRHVYAVREKDLLDMSMHSASPAAYDETRPFPTDAKAMAEAHGLVGKTCGPNPDVPPSAGYGTPRDYIPVIGSDTVVQPHEKHGQLFAFLIDTRNNGCRIADVVALPERKAGGTFLECSVSADDGSATPQSTGFGVRKAGVKKPVAYWEVNSKEMKLVRQPIDVRGWGDRIRCQQPEGGE